MTTAKKKILLCLLLLAVALVAPVSASPITLSNTSSTPDELHSGEMAHVSFDITYSPLTTGDVGYHFSTEFQDATWTYWVWVNDRYITSGEVQGVKVNTLPIGLTTSPEDSIRIHVQVTETAPIVTIKTHFCSADVSEKGRRGMQIFTFYEVLPIS